MLSANACGSIGLSIDLAARWHWAVDTRWIDIDANVTVDGTNVGEMRVDRMVCRACLGYRC